MKEAFKMHKIAIPAQSHHHHQQSVFANAYKNSDLLTQAASSTTHPTDSPSSQDLPIRNGSQYPNNTSSDWWRQFESQAPKPNRNEDTTVLSHNTSALSGSQNPPREKENLFHLFPHNRVRTLRLESKDMKQDASDRVLQDSSQHSLSSAICGHSQELSKAPRSEAASLSLEPNHLDNPEMRMKEPLAEDSAATLPEDRLSAFASLRQMVEDLEIPTAASPSIQSQSSASKSLLDLEPEAEIARFPTIFQLEREDLRSVNSKGTNLQGLTYSCMPPTRAKTVTSSNPAARLLQPFDPATERLAIGSSQNSVPRRSGTEQHRRRPYADQFSGTGRTLWEEFERPHAHSIAPRHLSRPEPRRPDVLSSQPNPSVVRSQSLMHHQPSNHPYSRRLAPMRSAFDLSGRQRNHGETSNMDQFRHQTAAAIGAPNLVRRSNTNSDDSQQRNVRNCIRTLQEMGYKPHSRLPIYAAACDGKLTEAMKMAEEDEEATQESQKMAKTEQVIFDCVQQLKSMGFGAEHDDEALKQFAERTAGNVELAIEAMEREGQRDSQARDRLRSGVPGGWFVNAGMPGSFP